MNGNGHDMAMPMAMSMSCHAHGHAHRMGRARMHYCKTSLICLVSLILLANA